MCIRDRHITAWAWQQVAKPDNADRQGLVSAAERIYSLLVDAEKMILDKFPHLSATLQKTLDTVDEADLERSFPEYTPERRVYEYLHPDSSDRSDRRSPEGHHCAALFLMRGTEGRELEGEIWVWNRILKRPLRIADMAIWDADVVAKRSLGGNLFRDYIALQLLHQDRILG